jgi:chromosome segregation protein
VFAAGSEWMKAFVVTDIKSMIMIAAYAKEQKLPRLRMIPLDVVSRFKEKQEMPRDEVNVIGKLSDFVHSDYDRLSAFLFSDILIVRNSSTAFMLSRKGYRTVSADGELFEPAGGSMSVDFGGRITDMTKAILFGESVENLRTMILKLSKLVEEKNTELQEISKRMSTGESERVELELIIRDGQRNITKEKESSEVKEKSVSELLLDNKALQSEADLLTTELEKYSRRLTLLSPAMEKLSSSLESISEEPSSKNELADKNILHNQIVKAIDIANIELGQTAGT